MSSTPQRTILLLLAAILATGIVVLSFPDRLLEAIHPWLERVASERLGGRVSYERLALRRGTLVVDGLRLERGDGMRGDVPHLEAQWTVAGLLGRRLDVLRVERPSLWFATTGEEREPLPSRPPWDIRQLIVADATLQLTTQGRTFQIRELQATGTVAPRTPFRLAGRFGEGEGLAVQLAGSFTWGEPALLALEEALWDGRPLLSSPLTLRLPASGATGEGELQLDRFDSQQLTVLLAALQIEPPLPEGWSFLLLSPRIGFQLAGEGAGIHLQTPFAHLAGAGVTLPLTEIALELTGGGEHWGGSASFALAGAPVRLQGEWTGEQVAGSVVLSIADPGHFKQQLVGGGFPLVAGGFELQAEFSRQGESGEARLQGRLRGLPGHRPPKFLFDLAPLQGELEVSRLIGGELSGRGSLGVQGREILRLRGTPQRLEAELLTAAGAELAALLPPEHRPEFAAGIAGLAGRAVLTRGPLDAWVGEGSLRAASIAFPGGLLRQVAFEGVVALADQQLHLRRASLRAGVEGEGVKGQIAITGAGSLAEGELRLQLSKLALSDLEYFAADGQTGLTGAHLAGTATLAGRTGQPLQLTLDADLGAREVLSGRFYADLSPLPMRLALRGRLDTAAKRLETQLLSLSTPGVGGAELHGILAAAGIDLTGRVLLPDLAQLTVGPLGEALTALHPSLADLRLAGGVTVEGKVQRDEAGWQGGGELQLAAMAIDWPAMRLVGRDIAGRLPLLIPGGGPNPSAGEARQGEIGFSLLRLGPAVLAPRPLQLAASREQFSIETPLLFALAGGELLIQGASLAWSEVPTVVAELSLRQVDLGELTRQLGVPEMAGRVSADLGRIRYRGDTLTADGALGINAFDGDILVRNLRMDAIFSNYRTFHGDIDFSGINLYQLTRAFEFGEINGIADGHVHGLRLFGATPSAFVARLETRESGRRNLSVKALHNISVLSQGGISAALSRGIYRFIDFYRYRKIGVYCSLENDVFTLRGTARTGTDDYLVDGGLFPPKINIIAPTRQVSFTEMLKRLQRMDRTETSTGGG